MRNQQILKQALTLVLCIFIYTGIENVCAEEYLNTAQKPSWPPEGHIIRCPVTRDTWISSFKEEKTGSNGGTKKLKLKGQQEYIILDIDTSALKGKIVTGALLHMRSASSGKAPLARVGVSTIASKWTEGTSKRYRAQTGSSCYVQAEYNKQNWAYPDSTLMGVTFGRGHTIWKFAECTPPDRSGWQAWAVDPDVIAARVAGLSHGFCLYDEVGSIWSLKKGKFKYSIFPNRFCYSRESGSGPWLEIWVRGTDSVPPEPVKSIEADIRQFPPGQALVRWKTPEDHGGGKTLGFLVTCKRGEEEKPMPRYLVPMGKKPGQEVRMHIRDISFEPGELISLFVRPVDSAGNVGQAFTKTIQLAGKTHLPDIPETDIRLFPPCTDLPTAGSLKIAVVDLLDKTDPKTGKMIPARAKGYKGGNHIFSASNKLVRLQAARNETIAFQLNLEDISTLSHTPAKEVTFAYTFDHHPDLRPKLYQFGYVDVVSNRGKVLSVLPDPLIPLKMETGNWKLETGNSISEIGNHKLETGRFQVSSPKFQTSVICELYVPHKEIPGKKKGKLVISADKEKLELDVELTVWNFTLPDRLSFVPEMNAYSAAVSPYNGYDYYRLAHEHRTCINLVPYAWSGIPRFAPKWKGHDFDWSEWDQKVGPLLDGSAFYDLPRKNEPVDVFYLPFNENWPVSLFDNYKPSYWADEAFASQYSENLKKSFAAFARHCDEKKWHDTIFQFYLNNKVYYREKDHRTSAPWLFDEPVNTQDFWALRWYGILWRSATDPVMGNAKMWYRGDISYSQFERNILSGIMNVAYLDLDYDKSQKIRMKQNEQVLWGKSHFSVYSTANQIQNPNTQPVLWCISAWSEGATGVLPWQTIGGKNCWKRADHNALFYPHLEGPKPSVRLKAFTRGQQDVEYLTLFCEIYQKPLFAVAELVKNMIGPEEKEINKSFAIDGLGMIGTDEPDTVRLWKLRYCIGKMLSERAPEYRRSLVNRQTHPWDIEKLPDIGYVSPAPEAERYKPDCDSFRPGKN